MSQELLEKIDIDAGWLAALEEEFAKPYMRHLLAFVRQERAGAVPIYPPSHCVFNAFKQTPFDRVKVVIIGQDPYHGPGQAHGLSFSVEKGMPIPPSLKNMIKELISDVGIPMPNHGCLESWAHQGVLLLNATLTVRQGQPRSHYRQGWEQFTDAAIGALAGRQIAYLLWGKSAQEKVMHILNEQSESNSLILKSPHPSPLSAYAGFFGCHHFSKVNAYLQQIGRAPIDWSIPD